MSKPLSLGDVQNTMVVVVRGYIYSDLAVETAQVVKGVFNLSLQALEGFTNSVFQLMDVPLTSPSYICISKRAKKSVEIKYRAKSHGPVAHVVINSTALKVYGEGEWKPRKLQSLQRILLVH